VITRSGNSITITITATMAEETANKGRSGVGSEVVRGGRIGLFGSGGMAC